MSTCDEARIRVHERWDSWRTAEIALTALREVYWAQPNGAPRPFLHGTVHCTDLVGEHFAHVCDPASVPHPVVVCILRHDLLGSTYFELATRIDGRSDDNASVELAGLSAAEQLDRLRQFGYRHHR